jgi:transposase-like protein
MTAGNGSERASLAQVILVDVPEFLRGIVERAQQAVLEAEMTAHLGAERYERRGLPSIRRRGRSRRRSDADDPDGARTRTDSRSIERHGVRSFAGSPMAESGNRNR